MTEQNKRPGLLLQRNVCGRLAYTLSLSLSIVVQAQSSAPGYLPFPDPGYGLYYHDSQVSPNVATRWGYHDGWEDGRHDRNHGSPMDDIKVKERYTTPPEHSGHPGSTRDQYIKLYRLAYLHGYEHGSRL